MDTVKNKNSSLTLDDGMPRVCGRPAGIFLVFPIHPPVSWIHMDSEETCI
jgi:hypothetical protein